jgi:Cys-tRNA(Pro) deacylase
MIGSAVVRIRLEPDGEVAFEAASRFGKPATQFLRTHGVAFVGHPYEYVEHGGTAVSARSLGVDEHAVVKTLVMQDEADEPLVALMHGDCSVSTKNLARQTGRKRIEPCRPEVAQRHSGYLVGGTSPFAIRRRCRCSSAACAYRASSAAGAAFW